MTSCTKTQKTQSRILHANILREPGSVDPRLGIDMIAENLLLMLFEGLTRLSKDLSWELALADAVELSEDKTVYTFHLRDAQWSDGSEVTAYDFEKSWLDLLDPAFASPNAYLLTPVKNAMEAKRGEVPLSEVGIRAIDEKTLRVELSLPFPAFLHLVANPFLSPICKAVNAIHPDWSTSAVHHVSNGPFHLVEWARSFEMKFARNPHYRGKQPKLDEIHFTLINNDASALHMYASGNLDLVGVGTSPIPLTYLKELKDRNALQFSPVAATLFVSFNTHKFPFHNVNIRKAFATAINRQTITEHVTQLDEEPALGLIPSLLKKGRKGHWISDGNLKQARHYLAEGLKELNVSKEALADLHLIYFNWELPHKIAQTLQQQWRDAFDLNILLESRDPKTALAATADRSYEFGVFGWKADFCDVSAYLDRLRYPDEFKNYPHWTNPAFTALIDAAYLEPDSDKRLDLFEQAEELFMNEMPLAPVFHYTFAFMLQPNIKGFWTNCLGQIHFDELSISK